MVSAGFSYISGGSSSGLHFPSLNAESLLGSAVSVSIPNNLIFHDERERFADAGLTSHLQNSFGRYVFRVPPGGGRTRRAHVRVSTCAISGRERGKSVRIVRLGVGGWCWKVCDETRKKEGLHAREKARTFSGRSSAVSWTIDLCYVGVVRRQNGAPQWAILTSIVSWSPSWIIREGARRTSRKSGRETMTRRRLHLPVG